MTELELWKLRAERLFQLLDDIDTMDDAAKSNDVKYRRGVRRLHLLRFKYATTDGYDLTWIKDIDTAPETTEDSMVRVFRAAHTKSQKNMFDKLWNFSIEIKAFKLLAFLIFIGAICAGFFIIQHNLTTRELQYQCIEQHCSQCSFSNMQKQH